ncbi:hypothetical protein AB0K12_35910 [Nonomuraea sp. NPDC049419]
MISKKAAAQVVAAIAITVVGFMAASPANAVTDPPSGGQVGTDGFTWSN